jgi:hypothetical protein
MRFSRRSRPSPAPWRLRLDALGRSARHTRCTHRPGASGGSPHRSSSPGRRPPARWSHARRRAGMLGRTRRDTRTHLAPRPRQSGVRSASMASWTDRVRIPEATQRTQESCASQVNCLCLRGDRRARARAQSRLHSRRGALVHPTAERVSGPAAHDRRASSQLPGAAESASTRGAPPARRGAALWPAHRDPGRRGRARGWSHRPRDRKGGDQSTLGLSSVAARIRCSRTDASCAAPACPKWTARLRTC